MTDSEKRETLDRARNDDEFEQACVAANHGRTALDGFNAALLDAARARWPDRWTELVPKPFAIASWVGCDTDGRTDIGWWDTVRYRLESKRMQLDRVMRDLPRLLPQAGLARAATLGFVYADVGRGAFFPGAAETYAPLVARAGLLPQAAVDRWLAEQRQAMTEGSFFAACNYYAHLATR